MNGQERENSMLIGKSEEDVKGKRSWDANKKSRQKIYPALKAITTVKYRLRTSCLYQQILAPDIDKNHNEKAELLTVLWWSMTESEPQMTTVHVFNGDRNLHTLGKRVKKEAVSTVCSNIIDHYQISCGHLSIICLELSGRLTVGANLILP